MITPLIRAERKDDAVNKAELVAHVAKESDLSKDAAEKAKPALRNLRTIIERTPDLIAYLVGRDSEGRIGVACNFFERTEKKDELTIDCDLVVNAAGAWGGTIGRMAGCEVTVYAGKGTMVAMNYRLKGLAPLIRADRKALTEAGVETTPRVSGSLAGQPQLEDGRSLKAEGVVWATGFRPDYHWINLPVFDEHGLPRHRRGVAAEAPGLYFVGLHFQSALSSALLGGVGPGRQAPQRPAVGPLHGGADLRPGRGRVEADVEDHHHVRADRGLHLDRPLRREHVGTPVDVAAEARALLGDVLADDALHLLRLGLILHRTIDQGRHILLPLLPIGIALRPIGHAMIVIGRTAAQYQ